MVAQLDRAYIKARPWKVWARLASYALFEGRPLLTRGRWINPLVFALFGLERRLPQLSQVRAPAFILGTGRSGTTILGIVLSMHRDVGFLNEPKALWHAIDPHEDLIGSYSCGSASYRRTDCDVTSDMREAASRIYGAYLAVTGSSRVVDKYPELIFRIPFVKSLFKDAKFLFLVRNGWATCSSIDGWSSRLGVVAGGETHDWWGRDRRKWHLLIDQVAKEHKDLSPHIGDMHHWTRQVDMAAVEWIVTMREGLRAMLEYPADVMRVDYEKLCENPGQVSVKIAEFLDLSPDDSQFINYCKSVLKPTSIPEPFVLDQRIAASFMNTMRQLGY